MGQLMNFYAGDPQVVGEAFSALDFDTLDDRSVVPGHVDFSLHLSPTDFDLLTQEAAVIVGCGPSGFIDSLTESVGGSGDESSADVLSPGWVRLMAAVQDAEVDRLASRWAEALAREYEDPQLRATEEMRGALRHLIALCRHAREIDMPVIHTWSL